MSTYKLQYFNVRGLAENIRMMFDIAGQEFEDARYPIDTSNFSKPEFDAGKLQLLKTVDCTSCYIVIFYYRIQL